MSATENGREMARRAMSGNPATAGLLAEMERGWARQDEEARAIRRAAAECTCHHTCAEDPRIRCSLSGEWHVHPGEPCPVHPDAPGDH
jgi:hypothetical protein